MSNFLPQALQKLIDHLTRLPGVGQKTAERLAFYLLKEDPHFLNDFGGAIQNLRNELVFCEECQNLSEGPVCKICADERRDRSVLCVVEEIFDLVAFEKTEEFRGVYHVLHGVISPIDGVRPADLTINALQKRLEFKKVEEVILATNPTIEGEATALYLYKLLQPLGLKMTRLARGLPSGGNLDYADKLTLMHSLSGRQEYFN